MDEQTSFLGDVERDVFGEAKRKVTIASEAYGGLPPHEKGSETSRAAADSMVPKAGTLRALVFDFIRHRVDGATDDEIERGLELRHQTASARRRELVISGHVRDSGFKRNTSSGRKAVVWVAT